MDKCILFQWIFVIFTIIFVYNKLDYTEFKKLPSLLNCYKRRTPSTFTNSNFFIKYLNILLKFIYFMLSLLWILRKFNEYILWIHNRKRKIVWVMMYYNNISKIWIFFFYSVTLLTYIYYNGCKIMEKLKKYEINYIFQINNHVIFHIYFIIYKLNKKYYINMYIGISQILRI